MRILRKISLIVRSNVNRMVRLGENPEKILDQTLDDMDESLRHARRQVIACMAREKKVRRQQAQGREEVAQWQARAEQRLQQGDEAGARTALQQKRLGQARLEHLGADLLRQQEQIGQLKQSLKALERKVIAAHQKRDLLLGRKRTAEARRQVHQALAGIGEVTATMSSTAFEQFDRIEDAVLTLESEAAATAELGAEGFLGWEAADLEDPDVAEELQALKVTMGLAPAPAAETASAEETESAVEVTVEAEPAPAPSS